MSFRRDIANRSRPPSKATVCAPVSRKVCLRDVQPTRAFVSATTGHCSAATRNLCDSKPVIGASCPSGYRASDRACAGTRKRDVHCHVTRSMSESLEEVKSTRTDSIKLISLIRKVHTLSCDTVQMGLRDRIATLFRSVAERPQAKTVLQAAQFASTVLFVVLYIWSTYSTPALWSTRYNLDLMLCCMFAVDYLSRFLVSVSVALHSNIQHTTLVIMCLLNVCCNSSRYVYLSALETV